MLKKAGVMLLPEKVGVSLCFLVIKRPCFERQIRKTRCKCRWLLSEDLAFGALPRLKCGPCAVHSFTQWVLYRQVLQMVMEWCFLLLVASFTISTV